MVCGVNTNRKIQRLEFMFQSLKGSFFLEEIINDVVSLRDKGFHIIPEEKRKSAYQEVLDMLTANRITNSHLLAQIINLGETCSISSESLDYIKRELINLDDLKYLGKATEMAFSY